MSHIVEVKTQVKDRAAVARSCQRLRLPPPSEGTFRLFSGTEKGLGVRLPGWKYPIVCRLPEGVLKFDNYEGRWGDPARLNEFLQIYAVEKALLEARKHGHSVSEERLPDGCIQVTIHAGHNGGGVA